MPAGYSFRPRLWALAAAAAACAAGIALGVWQAGRAEEKRKAEARIERISVRGEFLPERTVLLDNKLRRGRPGYEVVTPLRLVGAREMHVLVNRGWIAAGASRDEIPEPRKISGETVVQGIVREHLPRVLQAGPPQRGKVRQNLAVEDFALETGLALLPFVIEQHSRADDGLLREWPRAPGPEKNEMYSLQWYSLAALAVVLALALSFRKREK